MPLTFELGIDDEANQAGGPCANNRLFAHVGFGERCNVVGEMAEQTLPDLTGLAVPLKQQINHLTNTFMKHSRTNQP